MTTVEYNIAKAGYSRFNCKYDNLECKKKTTTVLVYTI